MGRVLRLRIDLKDGKRRSVNQVGMTKTLPICVCTICPLCMLQELDRFIAQVLPDRLKALEDWLVRTKVRPSGRGLNGVESTASSCGGRRRIPH